MRAWSIMGTVDRSAVGPHALGSAPRQPGAPPMSSVSGPLPHSKRGAGATNRLLVVTMSQCRKSWRGTGQAAVLYCTATRILFLRAVANFAAMLR